MKADSTIKADVLTEMKWDPSITHDKIQVEVENGIVTLLGTIPTFEEKKSAEKAVQRVRGVKAVVEALQVVATNSLVSDDQALAKSVIEQFRWHVHLPEKKIKVSVEKGWVTLSGEVDNKSQSRTAESIVRAMDGVVGVSNHLVFSHQEITPENVKRNIEQSLKHEVERDTKDIKIKIEGNKIILEGEVHSFKDMIAARESALNTPGIESVENNLIVD